MDHEKVFVVCENLCLEEGLTKEQIEERFASMDDIPTKTSDLTNNSNFVSDNDYHHTDNNYTTLDKNKLSGIATGANKTIVDSSLSTTSANPVQNKVITEALNNIPHIYITNTQPSTMVNGDIWITYEE